MREYHSAAHFVFVVDFGLIAIAAVHAHYPRRAKASASIDQRKSCILVFLRNRRRSAAPYINRMIYIFFHLTGCCYSFYSRESNNLTLLSKYIRCVHIIWLLVLFLQWIFQWPNIFNHFLLN